MRVIIEPAPGSNQRRIVADLPAATGPKTVAAGALLEILIDRNLFIMRRHWVPLLYSTNVRYQPEPPGPERFDHCLDVLARGWADCDDLVGWRCAELRLRGERAEPRIVWPTGTHRYHAQVRRADRTIEDPAAGMRRKNGR